MNLGVVSLKVEGMHCEGCAETIQRALTRVTGVNDVNISLAEKKVTVTFDTPTVNERSIADTVMGAGFKIDETSTTEKQDRTAVIHQNLLPVTAKKAAAIAAGAGFIGSTGFLPIMILFPNNPFAIYVDNLVGVQGTPGVTVQPGGWAIHATLVTIWAALFGFLAYRRKLTKVYVGAVIWALIAWAWTMAIIAAYGLFGPAVLFIEGFGALLYGWILAIGYSYGVWGNLEAKSPS